MVTVITVGGLIALLLLVGYGIYRLRRADLQVTELRTELARYSAEQRMRSELLHELLAPPKTHVPPKQRKPPKQRSSGKRPDYLKGLSVIGTAAVGTAVAARDHAPALLAVATVGGLLMLMPSHAPEDELPRPQIALPDQGVERPPTLESTPTPPTEPDTEEDAAAGTVEPDAAPETTDAPDAPVSMAPEGTEDGPDATSPPPEQEPEPREPPPEDPEPPAEPEAPDCSVIEVDLSPTAEVCLLPE